MCEEELRWLAEQAQKHTRIVEIGCWLGRSTRALADNTLGTVWAVDTWHRSSPELLGELDLHPRGWLWAEWQRNLASRTNVIPVRLNSLEAAEVLRGEKFEFVFIDAAHDYRSVCDDILAWSRLVAPSGLLAGHDYHGDYPGVGKAVDKLCQERQLGPGSIWWVIV
jgi:hypothetical protein